jgi:RHS repeat-associated protein
MVNASQTRVAEYRYDPYGRSLYTYDSLPGGGNRYRFSSKELVTSGNLYYYGYRFYDPNLQRWLSRDPIGEPGFRRLTAITTTSTAGNHFNLYAFVKNDPGRYVDPHGLFFWWLTGCSAPPDCKKIADGKRNCHQDTLDTDAASVGSDVPTADIASGKMAKDFQQMLTDKGYKEVPCSDANVSVMVWYMTAPDGSLVPLHSTRKDTCGWRHVGIGGKKGEVWCCKTRNASGPGSHGRPDKDFADPKTRKPNNNCFSK